MEFPRKDIIPLSLSDPLLRLPSISMLTSQNDDSDSLAERFYPSPPEPIIVAKPLDSVDWFSSPAPKIPVWPTLDAAVDYYESTPAPSPAIYSPVYHDSLDYFDLSFQKAVQPNAFVSPLAAISSDLTFSDPPNQSTWNPIWEKANSQAVSPHSASLSMIQNLLDLDEDEAPNDTEDPAFSHGHPLYQNNLSAIQTPQKGARGKPLRLPSKSISRKRPEQDHSSNVLPSPNGHQLRSTKPREKLSNYEKTRSSNFNTSKSARTAHNLVEKRYRTRLNGQFSTLLKALPQGVVVAEMNEPRRSDAIDGDRRINKAEVLVVATNRIKTLERDKKALESNRKRLLEYLEHLKRAWIDTSAVLLP